jgi:ABC-type bacteriocin/lantibiotic exporter with double-glycine peptidase domain
MGWFDEQIRQRIQNDDEIFADAFAQMVNLVSSEKIMSSFSEDRKLTEEAVGDILKYYHVKPQEIPDKMTDINEILEYLLRPSGIMRRHVKLSEGWYKDAVGAMLGTKKDGSVIALLPGKLHGYYYKDYATGNVAKVNKKNAAQIDEDAICFYMPFPLRKLNIIDLLQYIFRQLYAGDYAIILLATAVTTGLGMVTPAISRYLYGEVLDYGSTALLAGAILTMLCVNIASRFINIVKEILNSNIATKVNLAVESAVMMRMLSLKADFLKKYSSGDLSSRINGVMSLCTMLFNAIFTTGLTAIFSLVYIGQILAYAPSLVVPAILITLSTVVFSVVTALVQMRISKKQMAESGKESGMVYALINGVSKIKNAGAEKRAFAK